MMIRLGKREKEGFWVLEINSLKSLTRLKILKEIITGLHSNLLK